MRQQMLVVTESYVGPSPEAGHYLPYVTITNS